MNIIFQAILSFVKLYFVICFMRIEVICKFHTEVLENVGLNLLMKSNENSNFFM